MTSDSNRLRRILTQIAWYGTPGLMRWRTRRLKTARMNKVKAQVIDNPLLPIAEAERLLYRPLISVLVPVYDTPPQYLRLAVDSVLAQNYPGWELIISDDCSTSEETLSVLQQIATLDPRIVVLRCSVNSGISAATNVALAKARGEFVAMLDHDDEILPGALLEVVKALDADQTLDVIYTDQASVEPDGCVAHQFFKPDWSPEMFRGVMYVGHLLVVRRSLADAIGGFDPAFDNVQDYEFMLRVSENTSRIAHIPKILYHWRMIPGSVARGTHQKSNIEVLQAAAVNAHLARCGIEATAHQNPRHAHRIAISPHPRSQYPPTTVIIRATGAEKGAVALCKSLLNDTSRPRLEIILAGGRLSISQMQRLDSWGVIVVNPGEHGATALQAGLDRAQGELVISMAGDLVIETPDWLEHLLLGCNLPGVGCVTPLVLFANGRVSSAGLILEEKRGFVPAMHGWPAGADGYAGSLSCAREVIAVPGDCFAITRGLLSDLGGVNPYLATDYYQTVDLSIRAFSKGLRNLFTPRVIVRHSGKTGGEGNSNTLDRLLLSDVWEQLIKKGDHYHNRNFRQAPPGYQT